MSLQINLKTEVNHDSTFPFELTYDDSPLDLTGCTVTIYVKATRATDDDAAITYDSDGEEVTITAEKSGQVTWFWPRADNDIAGPLWWRLDVTDSGGHIIPYLFGNLTVLSV